MKNLFKYSLILIPFLIWSCEEVDNDFDIAASAEGAYVEFTSTNDTIDVAEDGTASLIARLSYGVPSDVAVSISVASENAAEGVDYVITNDGFSADGGTLNIAYDPDSENLDRDTVFFEFPTDVTPDGNKYVTVEITSASASGTDFSIGGEAQQFRVVFAISDIDCESELEGAYGATNCFPDPTQSSSWTEDTERNGRYGVSFITGGYYGYAGVPNISGVLIEQCGNIVTEETIIIPYTNGEPAIAIDVISGSIAEDGTITVNWTDSGGFAGPVECSTTFVPN